MENNPDDVHRISGSTSMYACDGSVRLASSACSSNFDLIELSLAVTHNPSVWMALTFSTFAGSPGGTAVGAAVISGGNPFDPGDPLQGWVKGDIGARILTISGDQADTSEYDLSNSFVTNRTDELEYYFFGLNDGNRVHEFGQGDIAMGDTEVFDSSGSPGFFSCAFCIDAGAGVAFVSPLRPEGFFSVDHKIVTSADVTFTYEAAVRVPAPATIWLLLGGFGMMLTAMHRGCK